MSCVTKKHVHQSLLVFFLGLTHLARLTKNKVKENCLILFISVNFLSSQHHNVFQMTEVFCLHLVLVFSLVLLTVITLAVIASSKTTEPNICLYLIL